MQEKIVQYLEGYLIFYDTVINQKYAEKIDGEANMKEVLV